MWDFYQVEILMAWDSKVDVGFVDAKHVNILVASDGQNHI